MGAKNMLRPVLGLLLVVNLVTAKQFDYELGQSLGLEEVVFVKMDVIGPFSYDNQVPIDVPENMELTRVRVTVWALSSPQVDINWNYDAVDITYKWPQITISTYRIEAYAAPTNPYDRTGKKKHASKSKHMKVALPIDNGHNGKKA